MTARLLRPFNINVAHKPIHRLSSYFTKHKDKTTTTATKNAIYMIPCRDCLQRYIRKTSIKIGTRITEHKNAIRRHDLRSLSAAHTYDNCHTFNCKETHLLGRAQTKHARESKEAWYSGEDNTINRHLDIPTIYLQLKTIRQIATNNDTNTTNTNVENQLQIIPSIKSFYHPWQRSTPIHDNAPFNHQWYYLTSKEPIRRSQRIHNLRQQRET